MVEIVSEFFGIIGVDMVPPENLSELIPYLLRVGVGCFLVSGVFGVIGKITDLFINHRRW